MLLHPDKKTVSIIKNTDKDFFISVIPKEIFYILYHKENKSATGTFCLNYNMRTV